MIHLTTGKPSEGMSTPCGPGRTHGEGHSLVAPVLSSGSGRTVDELLDAEYDEAVDALDGDKWSWRDLRPTWSDVLRMLAGLAWWAFLMFAGWYAGRAEVGFWIDNAVQCWTRAQ